VRQSDDAHQPASFRYPIITCLKMISPKSRDEPKFYFCTRRFSSLIFILYSL
jgi:hypothetical protein